VDIAPALFAVLKALFLPPAGLLLLSAAGLILMRRRRRLGLGLVVASWILLYLICTPLVASLLQRAVGTDQPVDTQALRSAQAIVILGGGLRIDAAEYGGDTLGGLTLERVRYGARLARTSGLPVLVTGGRAPWAKRAEGDVMRDALEQEFGVAVRWVENASRNTHENARKSAGILLPLGVKRVALVMHGFDVRRAEAEFRDAGFEVIAAPTLLPRISAGRASDLLPQPGALQVSYFSLYEIAALGVRPLR
jgi:uncharacterized SAM-binding protein YcdF (DUF218 family)